MPPTSDKKPRTHNKIPSDPSESAEQAIDDSGWEESILHPGFDDDIYYPHIRYGRYTDGEFHQTALQHLSEPIPESATTASTGIYFLTRKEQQRVKFGVSAKTIQESCEQDGRVAYTIVAESDALEKKIPAQTIVSWLMTFAQEVLAIEQDEYQLLYSGGRSIHLHTDYYVAQRCLEDLKADVIEFNQTENAELDVSLYKPKSQFRLVGARHRDTDLSKVSIQSDAKRADLTSAGNQSHPLALPHTIPHKRKKNSLVAGNADRSVLPNEYETRLHPAYIKQNYSVETVAVPEFDESYTNRYFSPYALTEDGERSVCILEPTGGPYTKLESQEIYVPSYVYAARGADGEYEMFRRKAPVLLSKPDFDKWNYQLGDRVVIIGGQSRNSRIFTVDKFDAEAAAGTLALDGDNREDALRWLEIQEYDIGASGMHGERKFKATSQDEKIRQIQSELERGEREPRYPEVLSVSCSLLQNGGWQRAWDWNKSVWDDKFDPEETHRLLSDVIQRYPEDYGHIEIPPR
ncbi:hypothetical protein [Salarchaeum japonicum]|uniref:Uncharacterized protein n=1 Tax=Salarchaeum japonicum TaxID=555573 RepID=A0AAV3SYY7_9EURY|nr:hypothetical protein [Salarchaeum japonicum]